MESSHQKQILTLNVRLLFHALANLEIHQTSGKKTSKIYFALYLFTFNL